MAFSYLLPTNSTSRLEVFSETISTKRQLLWSLSGYHGRIWTRAKIPLNSEDAFQVRQNMHLNNASVLYFFNNINWLTLLIISLNIISM
jgi:hypothetical protein